MADGRDGRVSRRIYGPVQLSGDDSGAAVFQMKQSAMLYRSERIASFSIWAANEKYSVMTLDEQCDIVSIDKAHSAGIKRGRNKL